LLDFKELKGGAYYSDCRVKEPTGTSEELGKKLWQFSEELIVKF